MADLSFNTNASSFKAAYGRRICMVEHAAVKGENMLLENNYRLTPQRKAVLQALAQAGKGAHSTAEEIYQIARENCSHLGLATVYRTLELLSKLSIVQCMILEDGKARYELKRNPVHHHLFCLKCGMIQEIEHEQLIPKQPETINFHILSASIHFFGHCNECST